MKVARAHTMLAGLLLAALLPSLSSATSNAGAGVGARPVLTGASQSPTTQILGVDAGRIAVLRNDKTILAAPLGRPLTKIRQAKLRQGWRQDFTDLNGRILRWTENAGQGRVEMHSLNLVTGTEKIRPTREAPLAWTPDGWIGYRDRTLTQHFSNGTSRALIVLPSSSSYDPPYVVSDGTRTLVYFDGRLLLLTDEGRTTQALYDAGQGPKLLSGLALTPHSEVWSLTATPDGSTGPKVFRQMGHGGTVVELDSPGELTAATDSSLTVLATGSSASPSSEDRHTVHLWDGVAWSQVRLPGKKDALGSLEELSGPVTDGQRFYLSVGAKAYRITGSGLRSVITGT